MADTRIKLKADFSQIQNSTRALINSITNLNKTFGTLAKPVLTAQQTLARMAYVSGQNKVVFLALGNSVRVASVAFTKFGSTVYNTAKANQAFVSSVTLKLRSLKAVQVEAKKAAMAMNMYAGATAAGKITQPGSVPGPVTGGGVQASKVPKGIATPKVPPPAAAISGFTKLTGAIGGAIGALGRLIASFGPLAAILGAAKLLEYAKSATELNNRLRIVTPTGKKVSDTFNDIAKIAKDTRMPVEETAVTFTRFSLATQRMGYTSDQVKVAVGNLNKMMKIQGVTSHEARSAMLQLSQGLQSGRLAGDEFRAVQEILPALLGDIADATGYPIEQLKSLASEGKITPKVVMDALLGNTAKIDAMFKRTNMTFADFGIQVTNVFTTVLANFQNLNGGASVLSGTFDVLLSVVEILGSALGVVVKVIALVAQGIAWADKKLGSLYNTFNKALKFINPFAFLMEKAKESIPGSEEAGFFAQFVNGIKLGMGQLDEALSGVLDNEVAKAPETEAERLARIKKEEDEARQRRNNQALQDFQSLKTGMDFTDLVMTLDTFDEKMGEVFYQGLFQDLPNGFGSAVSDMVMEGESLKDGLSKMFKDMAKKIIASLVSMVVQMLIVQAIMSSLGLTTLNMAGSGVEGGGGISSLFKGFGKSLFGGKKAMGGPVASGRAYLVGEEGPEIFAPASSGSIIPNDEIGGMGGGLVIQNLSIMPNASIDQALMDKPASYWLEMVQAKVLPALNELGQGGETTSLGFRGAR